MFVCTRYCRTVGLTVISTAQSDIDNVVPPIFSGSNEERIVCVGTCGCRPSRSRGRPVPRAWVARGEEEDRRGWDAGFPG